jgi:hypothetical protein
VSQRTDLRESTIFGGRRGGARPSTFASRTQSDAFAGGLTAREFRPMDPRYRPTSVLDRPRPPVPHLDRQERYPMNANLSNLNHAVAGLRAADLYAEAAQFRLARDARAARPARTFRVLVALRRVVGTALVRTGERVQGAQRPAAPAAGPAPADFGALTGHLRVVR